MGNFDRAGWFGSQRIPRVWGCCLAVNCVFQKIVVKPGGTLPYLSPLTVSGAGISNTLPPPFSFSRAVSLSLSVIRMSLGTVVSTSFGYTQKSQSFEKSVPLIETVSIIFFALLIFDSGSLISPSEVPLPNGIVLARSSPDAILQPLASVIVQNGTAFSIVAGPKWEISTLARNVSSEVHTRFSIRASGTVSLQNRRYSCGLIYPFSSQKASSTPTSAVPWPEKS